MVQIIAGRKGKGKTKHLLDMANDSIKKAIGSIVYLDKSSKHMYRTFCTMDPQRHQIHRTAPLFSEGD